MKLKLITSLFFIAGFAFNCFSQTTAKVVIEKKQMEPDIYAFLKKIEDKEIGSIILSKNVTQYNRVSGTDETNLYTQVNYYDDETMGYDSYTLSYTGSLSDLVVQYSYWMGQNITTGTLTKLGDHYVLFEIYTSRFSCITTIYKDGVKILEKQEEDK